MLRKVPKGTLILIGGAEDKGEEGAVDIEYRSRDFERFEILSKLVPDKKSGGKIEIITTASSQPHEVADMYKKAFNKMGFKHVDFMNMGNNYDAKNPRFLKRIEKAEAVLFSGGDQFRLSTIMGNTDVLRAVLERYLDDKDFTVAGTSAGAMALPTLMMFEGENNEAMLRGSVKISSGMGFIDGCLVDTHFVKRGRFGRLAQAVIMNPTCIGIGLGEDTALVIRKGNMAECTGSGMVTIIDGCDVGHTNIAYAEDDSPLCIENLRVHILCKCTRFQLHDRKFIPSKENMKKEREAESEL